MLACRVTRLTPVRNILNRGRKFSANPSRKPPSVDPTSKLTNANVNANVNTNAQVGTPPPKSSGGVVPLLIALGLGMAVPAAFYNSPQLREAILPLQVQRLYDSGAGKAFQDKTEEEKARSLFVPVATITTTSTATNIPHTNVGVTAASSPSTLSTLINPLSPAISTSSISSPLNLPSSSSSALFSSSSSPSASPSFSSSPSAFANDENISSLPSSSSSSASPLLHSHVPPSTSSSSFVEQSDSSPHFSTITSLPSVTTTAASNDEPINNAVVATTTTTAPLSVTHGSPLTSDTTFNSTPSFLSLDNAPSTSFTSTTATHATIPSLISSLTSTFSSSPSSSSSSADPSASSSSPLPETGSAEALVNDRAHLQFQEEVKEMKATLTELEKTLTEQVLALDQAAAMVDNGRSADEVIKAVREILQDELDVTPSPPLPVKKSFAETQTEVVRTVVEEQAAQASPTLSAVVEKQLAATEETLEAKFALIRAEVNTYLEQLLKQKQHPSDVKAEFAGLLGQAEQKARAEFVDALKLQAQSIQSQMQESVQGLVQEALVKQDILIAEFLDYAIEERVKEAAAVIREEYEAEKRERLADLHALKIEARAFENVFEGQSKYQLSADKLLRLSNAVISINQAIARSVPFENVWEVLKDAAAEDEVLSVAVNMVPQEVAVHGTVPWPALKRRFRSVERAGITAAYLPPNPSFYGHLLAQVFGFLTLRERELVAGTDDHACLSRAGYFMKKDDLPQAVSELEQLSPAVKQVCLDWQREAMERLVLDQALDLIRARIQTLRMALV